MSESIRLTREQLIEVCKASYDDGQRDLAETLVEAGVAIPPAAMAILNACKTAPETLEKFGKETPNV